MRIKLYNTWEKVKDTFVKPSLKVYFGKWKNDPNLPVYRMGPKLFLCPRKKLIKYCHLLNDSVLITVGTKTEKIGGKEYSFVIKEHTKHTLPKNLRCWEYMWNSKVRKKLRKWHLGWIKPVYYLPIWLRFGIINTDVHYKWKWNSIRYEFPPQLTFYGFGLSLTFTLHCPIQTTYSSDDCYWESILIHLYSNKSGELKETIEEAGIWERMPNKVYFFATRPTYIVPSRQNEYYAAVSEIKAASNDKVIV